MWKALGFVEFWVVMGYLVLMIGIGVLLARRNRGGTDFFAGGRAIPWWVAGVSLYMGNFSAWLFTGGAGMIYKTTGYGLIFFLCTGAAAYFLGSQLTATQWRRSRVISPVEFTRRRFGLTTQQVLGILTAVVFVAAAGNQLKAIATVVESILHVPIVTAAVAIGLIVILYTLIGGLWAVVVTDVLQFVVLLGVTLLIAPLALGLVEGGLGSVVGVIELNIPPTYGEPFHDVHYLIASLLLFTIGVAGGQGPRFYCVPDERSARKVGALAAFLFLTTPVLFSLPPLVARALWGGPDVLGQTISGDNPHEQVFIHVAKEVLPPGLLGVFLAAMFAATMSALDTVYNMIASILSRDVYSQLRRNVSDRELLRVGRVMTLVIGVATIGLCLYYIAGKKDLFSVMLDIVQLSGPIMNVPLLMGLLFRRAPRSAGLACILWGMITALVMKYGLVWEWGPQVYLTEAVCLMAFLVSPWLAGLWKNRDTRPYVAVLSVVFAAIAFGVAALGTPDNPVGSRFSTFHLGWMVAYGVSMGGLLPVFAWWFARPEDRTGVDAFYADLDRPVDVSQEVTGSAEAALSVFRLVGVLTFVIAGLVLVLMAVELASPPEKGAEPGKYLILAGILVGLAVLFLAPSWRRTRSGETAAVESVSGE